jgi:hypothetical protein
MLMKKDKRVDVMIYVLGAVSIALALTVIISILFKLW